MIDTQGIRQGIAETRGGGDVQQQPTIALLKIEIDQSDSARLPMREMPRQIRRQRGRTDAASRADKRYDLRELRRGSADITRIGLRGECLDQEFPCQRLDNIVGDPGI